MAMSSEDVYNWLVSLEGMPSKVSLLSGKGAPSDDDVPTKFTFYIDTENKAVYTTDLVNEKWEKGIGGGGLTTTEKSSSFTLSVGSLYMCDVTTSSIDITMPETEDLKVGDTFEVMISGGDASVNNLTLLMTLKTQPIEGDNDDFIFDVNSYFKFIWVGGTIGWKTFSQNGGVPQYGLVGEIKAYSSLTPPEGYLTCMGQNVSRTTYAKLFSIIGTKFGSDSDTTFKVPNLKGRSFFGYDSSNTYFNELGKTGGATEVTLSVNQIPSHRHGYTYPSGSIATGMGFGSSPTGGSGGDTGYTGGGQSHLNMPPYFTGTWLIKY